MHSPCSLMPGPDGADPQRTAAPAWPLFQNTVCLAGDCPGGSTFPDRENILRIPRCQPVLQTHRSPHRPLAACLWREISNGGILKAAGEGGRGNLINFMKVGYFQNETVARSIYSGSRTCLIFQRLFARLGQIADKYL